MARTLLVVPSAAGAASPGRASACVRGLDRRGVNVAFVKAVPSPGPAGGPDRSTALAAAISASASGSAVHRRAGAAAQRGRD